MATIASSRKAAKLRKDKREKAPKPQKKPLVINYDRDGNRIGPDGFAMTPVRKRMHFLLNAAFVWGVACFVISFALALAAFLQGQQYTGIGLDVVFYGGNMFNGVELALILRVEALMALFTTVMGPLISIQGFRWFYERKTEVPTMVLTGVLAFASLLYQFTAITMVGFVDPLTLVSLVLVAALWITMRSVKAEHPSLSKAKVAKTVTK